MGRISTIITFILAIFLVNCRQINSENDKELITSNGVDTFIVAILSYDTVHDRNFKHVFKSGAPTHLTFNEVMKIDTILNNCINNFNAEQELEFTKFIKENPELKRDKKHFVIYLTRYKRQYVAIINSKEEKEVWVNCFCTPSRTENWRNQLVIGMEDGGNCFFNLKLNLTTGQCYEFIVNKEA